MTLTVEKGATTVANADCVKVTVRFVPTGITRKQGVPGGTLTGTLLLSPVVGSQARVCTHEVDLARWPRDVEALIARHGIEIHLVPLDANDPTRPVAAPIPLPAGRVGGVVRGQAELGVAAGLWTRLFGATTAEGANLLWQALHVGEAAGGEATGAPASDVIATGQGDAGLLLSLERSRSVLDRIAGAPATAPRADGVLRPAEALKTRTAARQEDRKANSPWLLSVPAQPDATKMQRKELLELQRREREALTEAKLRARRAETAQQAQARRDYRAAVTPEALRQRLAAMSRARPSGTAPTAALQTVATGDDAALEQLLDHSRLLHYAGTRADPPEPAKAMAMPLSDEAQHALQRFFTVANQPKLARVLNLVVDVAIPLGPEQWAALDRLPPNGPGADRFVFASARLGDAGDGRVIWTTAKLRVPREANDPAALFWPCTREEAHARAVGYSHAALLEAGLAAQVDGLVHLGAAQMAGGERHPRFDLLSIDPRRATEADLGADSQAAWGQNGGLTTVGTVPDGGLVLVDRWRQFQAASRAADQMSEPSGPAMVIDAEDLTVGLRLDVRLDGGGRAGWRSLVERRISFGDQAIEANVAALVPDGALRASLDAAPLTVSARMRANPGAAGVTTFTEEIVAQWLGEPLGVDLHAGAAGNRAADWPANSARAVQTSLVDVAMEYRLVDAGPDRPPRQCYGWAFRVGARAQLEGGLARPLASAAAAYEAADGFVLPGPRSFSGRRLLRHRRIEAPVVTTPLDVLRRVVPGPQETALELAVRSSTGADGALKALGPETTHRVLVPPPVSLEFADRHDVFDTARVETGPDGAVRPRGGLTAIAYDRKSFGTFPIWSRQQYSEGACYPDWVAPKPGMTADLGQQPYPVPTGDAIFMPRQSGTRPSDRPHPYYPDPAAELMVFRLRRENGDDIGGESLVVRVRRPGVAFPEVTPIAVQLVRLGAPAPLDQGRLGLDIGSKAGLATGHGARQRVAATAYLDATVGIGREPGGGRVEGARVVARVAPGERLQLDVWCLPRWETLAALFDTVEAAALLVQATGGPPDTCLSDAAFVRTLAGIVSRPVEEVADVLASVSTVQGRRSAGPCGPGHLELPCWNHLSLVAALIQRSALDQVVPELAARTTLWLTHAIDKPLRAPGFDLPAGAAAVSVRRTETGQALLAGSVMVDRATSRFLEVRARGACLVSGAFDDPRRGRSDDDQARGIWPSTGIGLDKGGWRTPRELFGFTVGHDGAVTLPSEELTLLRIDDIAAASPDGDLLDLGRVEALTDGSRAIRPDTIGDAKARVLELSLVAGSRTAPLIRGDDGAALPASGQSVRSAASRLVLLHASKAPARVAPLTIRPVFQTTYHGLSAARKTRLRVRMRRPWFSSGEGERLGIVLWPPDLASRASTWNTDLIARDAQTGPGEASTMDMAKLSDLDLGPGGEFVTRWGGDPIAPRQAPQRWLLPPTCFAQAAFGSPCPWSPDQPGAELAELVYVPRAIMPLPLPPGAAPGSLPATMMVALLAFRPRFDVDLEHFYVDIEIDPGVALEPFLRLGLVRYQANAPPALRVSEPVVEWAQLLPSRQLNATIEQGAKGLGVKVEVTGPGRLGRDASEMDGTLSARMCFAVYKLDADGRQSLVAESSALAGTSTPTWCSTADLLALDEHPAQPAKKGVRYVLVAQEHDEMSPATYPDEPFDPARADAVDQPIKSGPRFAAWIDLTHPAPTGSEETAFQPVLLTYLG